MITRERPCSVMPGGLARFWSLGLIVSAVLFAVAAPAASLAQSSACAAAPDSLSLWRINTIRGLMHRTEPAIVATMNRLKIPVVSDTSSIVFVTDSKVCSKARAAFNARLTTIGATRPPATLVVVIKVGNTYVVRDTFVSQDEWHYEMVMTKQYQVLSAYGA